MKLKQLRRTHADFAPDTLQCHRDLFVGGEQFAKNITRYLLKNDQELHQVYQRRCELAKAEYINYCGPIGNYFASWAFTSKLTFDSDPKEVDEFYKDF
jgi:hypothetical protein